MSPEGHHDFKPIHTFDGIVEKALLADVLMDLEIPFLIDDHAADLIAQIFQPQKGAGRLLVLEPDIDRVRAIISDLAEAAAIGNWIEE